MLRPLLAHLGALALLSGCYASNGRSGPPSPAPEREPAPAPDSSPLPEPASHARAVVADNWITCAIGEDGRVRCWGRYMGLVYSRVHDAGAAPTLLSGLERVAALSVSSDHACALDEDGAVWCWGFATWGQLGIPREDPDLGEAFHAEPVRVATLPPAIDVAVSWMHSCALLADGRVACWGHDGLSELPVDIAEEYTALPVFAPGLEDVVALDTHGPTTCALHASGRVTCWGENHLGEAGPHDGARTHAIAVRDAIDVYGGHSLSFALGRDGTVWRWGATEHGARGDGIPRAIGVIPDARELVVSTRPCALRGDGTVACLPDRLTPRATPREDALLEGLPPVRQIAIGYQHVCLRARDDGLYCRGSNGYGEIGVGARGNVLPDEARVALRDVERVARGTEFACALASTGLFCWGNGENGALGDGGAGLRSSPARVPLEGVTAFDVGASGACAVADDSVFCWGENLHGEAGTATGEPIRSPRRIAVPGRAMDVALGEAHACALADLGVFCWGDGSHGQIGDDSFRDRMPPTRVPIEGVVALAAGQQHTCALLESGEVACWGDDRHGQLGCRPACDGLSGGPPGVVAITTPVHVAGVSGATELRAAGHVTCVGSSEEAHCWPGMDLLPVRVGTVHFPADDGTMLVCDADLACRSLTSSEPPEVRMPRGLRAADLAFDGWSGCVLDGARDLRCWGDGQLGQLGDGLGVFVSPTPISFETST